MNKKLLNLAVENITFDLEMNKDKSGFYWRVIIDEADNNPVYYGDYLTNEKMFEFINKLKELENEQKM